MSAERRWDQRRFVLSESATTNGGERTVFIETMTPGTTVPPHFHTRFSEIFDLLGGSITVYNTDEPDPYVLEASAQQLQIGTPVIVQPGRYHKYLVGKEVEGVTRLRVIVEPGDLDFERLLKILDGLGRNGELDKMGDDVVLMAVIMELADAHLIGPAKELLDEVRTTKSVEVREMKEVLLHRYDTMEGLRRLMAKDG